MFSIFRTQFTPFGSGTPENEAPNPLGIIVGLYAKESISFS
jgi:hypothetical protein